MSKNKVSPEVQEQALKVAKGIQKPGQTKEQTKLIAQGIEKGIAEYKKQQNKKLREKDKIRKQELKSRQSNTSEALNVSELGDTSGTNGVTQKLPWILLGFSWIGFVIYLNL